MSEKCPRCHGTGALYVDHPGLNYRSYQDCPDCDVAANRKASDAEGWREFVRRRIAEQEGVPVESVNVNEWGTHVSVAKEGRTPVTIIQYVRKPTDQPGEAGEANE